MKAKLVFSLVVLDALLLLPACGYIASTSETETTIYDEVENPTYINENDLYSLLGTVTSFDVDTETATIRTTDGNEWQFVNSDVWVNAEYTLVLDSKGTEDMSDDVIVSERKVD